MEITSKVEGTTLIVSAEGKLTVQTSPDLSAVIEQAPEQVVDIEIDLANISYVSSAGLRVFVAADKLSNLRGGHLRLLNPVDEVYDVFDMTGLTDVLQIVR